MKFLPYAVFSLLLLLASGTLMLMHWRSWNNYRQQDLPQTDFHFRRRQFRRRMQSSAMIGIIGIALFFGAMLFLGHESLIPWFEDPVIIFVYWAAVFFITVWMALLALVDIWASQRYVNRILETDLLEQTKLHAELYRQKRANLEKQKAAGNGEGKEIP
jgi:membrane protein implicated in regulation of membrane protease activity